ncbi:MAG: ABC-ATPase domain-containing protein [Oscillospiraceae bacterium]|nr:ABC-ATPase domain-containing protein [Oscillospiraceae bacterium]
MLGIASHDRQFDIMTADYCLRKFAKYIENIYLEKEHNTGKEKYTGKIYIYEPNQKIILRNSSYVKNDFVYISIVIRFPILMASKRTVVAEKIPARIVQKELARAICDFVKLFNVNDYEAKAVVYRRQQEIRQMLKEKGLVSFIANGSILPRDEQGLKLLGAVPFMSPPEDEIELHLSDGLALKGMGIKEGVTVITGGGYSGKSTLLDAMLHGIYDHIPGDGREYCITSENACKIAAEDGRNVTSLDISPFIRNVSGLDTKTFTTQHASGSTSQAANIMEAISFGCGALLIDEDRTATNFMIRDARMKKIIKDDPIVPFTDRVRQIYRDTGISTVLIIGGSSEYLDLADNVYIMKDYRIYNYNKEVAQTKQNTFDFFTVNDRESIQWRLDRTIGKDPMMTFKKDEETNRIREFIAVTDEEIYVGINKANVSHLDTIISQQQMTAIVFIIRSLFNSQKDSKCRLFEEITGIYNKILTDGFAGIYSTNFGIDFNMELPVLHDILFAVSRMDNIVYMCGQSQ